jgi:hypothetical protein
MIPEIGEDERRRRPRASAGPVGGGLLRRLIAVWGVAWAACGPKTVATTDAGGTGTDGGYCPGAGQWSATAEGVTFTYACFLAMAPGFPNFIDAQVVMETDSTVSSQGGTAGSGPQIMFSTSCSFDAGQTVLLTDPCLYVANGVDSSIPSTWAGYQGFVNNCTTSATQDPGLNNPTCSDIAQSMLSSQTSGSLTINQWNTAALGTVQVTFSSNAQLTAVWLAPGATQLVTIPVSVSGSATAVNDQN